MVRTASPFLSPRLSFGRQPRRHGYRPSADEAEKRRLRWSLWMKSLDARKRRRSRADKIKEIARWVADISFEQAPAATSGGKKQKKKWSKGKGMLCPVVLPINQPTNARSSRSQGQGQPRRNSRQSHLRQALQGRTVIPTHHGRNAGGQTEDQWESCKRGAQGSGGEGAD